MAYLLDTCVLSELANPRPGAAEARGEPLPVVDALLAATGDVHDLEVVTRNTADLERCGARCVNPWR